MAERGAYAEAPQWQSYLTSEEFDVPLHALRPTTKKKLSLYLDEEDALIHGDFVSNYEGLAEKVGFSGLEIRAMERASNHTKYLLQEWMGRQDLRPIMGRLIQFLLELGRDDALLDCQSFIKADIKAYQDKPQQFDKMPAPIQDETVSQGPGVEDVPSLVTRQDVDQGIQVLYDAFVCYNPLGESKKDLEFVRKLIDVFENPPFNFKLFVPWRDDLVGLNSHTISAMLISQRCRHMIVVLSQNFLRSPACEFQSTFAHALSPGARSKRLVPIKIQECPIPNILRIMACCDFTREDLWDWSWGRLARSISIPLSRTDFMVQEPGASMDGLIRLGANSSTSLSSESGFNSISEGSVTMPIARRAPSPNENVRKTVTAPVAYNPQQPEAMEINNSSEHGSQEILSVPMTSNTAPVIRSKSKSPSRPFTPIKSLTARITGKKKKEKAKMPVTE